MISKIRGQVAEQRTTGLLLETQGISYEVFIPASILKSLEPSLAPGAELQLFTWHYHQVGPSRSLPILIGFTNEIEREFFERFITVSGVGPKAALKAMALPFRQIADAIDRGDVALLKSLPGIGERRAREIIAKLQGKVGKYGLLRDGVPLPPGPDLDAAPSFIEETETVLAQLGYSKSEARTMVRQALERNAEAANTEELLNAVYAQHKQVAA